MNTSKLRLFKKIALSLSVLMLVEALYPIQAYALTAGPGSPEFSSFTPVATSDMVNVFSGDMNYNLPVIEIPGSDGGGYALSLSYNSGVSSEEEASWVGHGWNLNPGSVNRNMRGYPDDYKDAPVTFFNKTRPNWSMTATKEIGLEVFGQDQANIGVNASVITRVNNHQGLYISRGFGFNVLGMGLNMNQDPNGVTFSYDINPAGLLSKLSKKGKEKADNDKKTKTDKHNNKMTFEEARKASSVKMNSQMSMKSMLSGYVNQLGSSYGLFTYGEAVRGASLTEYKGFAFNNAGISATVNAYVPVGIHTRFLNSSFNIQYNKYKNEESASGYMYSDGRNGPRDYFVEKDIPFAPRSYFLGIPFNNSDIYNVSGEGIGGGFKFYPNELSQFSPNPIESKTQIFQVGVEFIISQNVGIGVEFGIGVGYNTVKEWITAGSFSNDGVFRFNNDLGGEAIYGNNAIESASMNFNRLAVPGTKVVLASTKGYNLTETGRSSYVDRHAYKDFSSTNKGFTNDHVGTGYSPDAIAELAIFNQDGMRYVYGEPVYTRNETNIQVDTKADESKVRNRYIAYRNLPLESVNNVYDVNSSALESDNYKVLTGEIKRQPYASTYLLTALTTSDYVDVGSNGLDDQDFGGWTKLSYRQAYGGSGTWYRYRTPYTGLLYQQGQVSDVWDDAGSVVTGEKEVKYLDKIETKTHVAYFVTNKSQGSSSYTTGSGKKRLDALGAVPVGSNDPAANNEFAKGTTELEYLEKIVLFSKDRPNKPIKVIRFDYDYSLVQNLPNNLNGDFPSNRNDGNNQYNQKSGKLTLKRVWFEYEGTVPSKISPYEFSYEYAISSHFNAGVSSIYNNIVTYGDQFSASSQNPDYTPNLLDQWGCVQPYGAERDNAGIRTRYQGDKLLQKGLYGWRKDIVPNQSFDPAAWNLKSIKLPSGGEIHIQYEEKDYQYVQDRAVMGQASLIPGMSYDDPTSTGNPINYDKNTVSDAYYVVNPEDLGANATSTTEVQALTDKINAFFGESANGTDVASKKIHFNFLYSLRGNNPSLDLCTSEYINGYANFKKAELVPVPSGGYGVKITLGTESSANGQYASIPRQACVKYVTTQREQKLNLPNCQSNVEGDKDPTMRQFANEHQSSTVFNLQEAIDQVKLGLDAQNVPQYGKNMFEAQEKLYNAPGYTMADICRSIKEENSTLKLPLFRAKKGGGIRVKRLLMYDPGIESGDAALYGSEYNYNLEDGTSSGVATNEPSSGRDENPLVTFLPKKGQNWFSKITAGEDKEQTEGPIGETLLPSPSVGYSRVVVKNIHQGISSTGVTVHQFYTVKDYPYDRYYNQDGINDNGVSNTNLSETSTKDRLVLPAGLFNFTLVRSWAVQGFRFIQNSMHGQIKSVATYGGVSGAFTDPSQGYLTSLKEYNYFEPGESVPLMKSEQGQVVFEEGHPGKEMDVAMESRNVSDYTFDFKLGIDVSITISWVPPIFVTVAPSFSLNDEMIKTHATSKVIRYPTIIKNVLSYQDGIYSLSENLAFDKYTGQPRLIRTFDSFHKVKLGDSPTATELDGSMYNFPVFPASYKYEQMGQKALDPSNTNQLSAQTGTFISYAALGDPRNSGWLNAPKNVISASIQTYANGWGSSWSDGNINADFPGTSAEAPALSSVYRPLSNYVYKSDAMSSSNQGSKIYDGGYFNIDKPFDWLTENNNVINNNTGWLRSSSITLYSPHGSALEEVNALGIYSANKFGYNQKLVTMSAQNARYGNLYFEDYENKASASSTVAHSGEKSLSLTMNGSVGQLSSLTTPITVSPEFNKGALLKLWAKQAVVSAANPIALSAQVGASVYAMDKVASTGEWALYSVRIPASGISGSQLQVDLNYNQAIYIDDVRFQPYESQATCYVYDVQSLRPIVFFDDQHFGMYYQYNSEGKLVRKIIETERGMKTVQETQYNTPRVNRQ